MEVCATISAPGSSFSPILFVGDYEAQIERIAKLGFRGVELHIRDPRAVDARGILAKARALGVRIATIGTGQAYVDEGLSFTSADREVYGRAIQRIKDQIDLAQYWGSKVIIGTIRGKLPAEPGARAKALGQMVQAFHEVAGYAAGRGVTLTVEAINRYEMNFLNTAGETLEFIDGLGEPALGLHLDTFHMNIEEVSMTDAIRRAGRKLVHIHFADSNRYAPGWGHIDFSAVVQALRDIGYDGVIALEHFPVPEPDAASIQGLRHIIGILQAE